MKNDRVNTSQAILLLAIKQGKYKGRTTSNAESTEQSILFGSTLAVDLMVLQNKGWLTIGDAPQYVPRITFPGESRIARMLYLDKDEVAPMGSASGRRKCCQFYFDRGYREGFERGRYNGKPIDEPWEENALIHASGTISRSLGGLWRYGYDQGLKDRGSKSNPRAYYEYTLKRKNLQDVLASLEDGFKLEYKPDSGWPRHPFTLTSQGGAFIWRRTTADLRHALDHANHSGERSPIHAALVELPSEARNRRQADRAVHRVKL